MRGELVGLGRGGGVGKVTEMLKDERGGGEIISHYKWRERDTLWRSSLGVSTELMSSRPARPELSHSFFLLFSFLPSLSAEA